MNQPGELCVSGESLAEGYYRNPELTARSFVIMDGERAYRTGDIAYLGSDGNWYYVGRRDSQIKHMGHRIELGEVETAMGSVPVIDRVCCLFDHTRDRIYSFFQGDIEPKELRCKLKEIIPGYMIPSQLVRVDTFELNAHGKIDRNELYRRIEREYI